MIPLKLLILFQTLSISFSFIRFKKFYSFLSFLSVLSQCNFVNITLRNNPNYRLSFTKTCLQVHIHFYTRYCKQIGLIIFLFIYLFYFKGFGHLQQQQQQQQLQQQLQHLKVLFNIHLYIFTLCKFFWLRVRFSDFCRFSGLFFLLNILFNQVSGSLDQLLRL